MQSNDQKRNFWLGNALLGLALIVLLNMDGLSRGMGMWAVVLWIALAGAGAYFLLKDKRQSPSDPH